MFLEVNLNVILINFYITVLDYSRWKNVLKQLFDTLLQQTHLDLMQESSIFIWGLKQFQLCIHRKILKNLYVTSLPPWRRWCKTNFADSICSEELIFQFSAKSDNIYYVFPQNRQNHSLILPPLLWNERILYLQ